MKFEKIDIQDLQKKLAELGKLNYILQPCNMQLNLFEPNSPKNGYKIALGNYPECVALIYFDKNKKAQLASLMINNGKDTEVVINSTFPNYERAHAIMFEMFNKIISKKKDANK